MDQPKYVKLSVNLREEDVARLRELAARSGSTMTDALRRAIATETFLEEAQDKGAKILIEERGDQVQRLVLR